MNIQGHQLSGEESRFRCVLVRRKLHGCCHIHWLWSQERTVKYLLLSLEN